MNANRPLKWMSYERVLVERAWARAESHVAQELLLVLGTALAAAVLDALLKGTIDGQTIYFGSVAAVGGIIVLMLRFLLPEPVRMHNELVAEINRLQQGYTFAQLLRVRKDMIERIEPLSTEPAAIAAAQKQLQNEQANVVSLLDRPDNPWKHAPDDWHADRPPLIRWAGLAAVLSMRYQGEVAKPLQLMVPVSRASFKITPDCFPMVRDHAATCVALLIREIEYPHLAKRSEEPGAFQAWCAIYDGTASDPEKD